MAVLLTDPLIKTMACGRMLPASSLRTASVNAIDYHSSGTLLAASCDDGTISVFDALEAQRKLPEVKSKEAGARLVRFTHHPNALIYAGIGNKHGHSVHYLDALRGAFIAHFPAYGTLRSISVHPEDDTFLAASDDPRGGGSLRLWDLRCPERAIGETGNVPSAGLPPMPAGTAPALGAFDPTGKIFAFIPGNGLSIRLYDRTNFRPGAFETLDQGEWTRMLQGSSVRSMEFSPHGGLILLTTDGPNCLVLESDKLTLQCTLLRRAPARGSSARAVGAGPAAALPATFSACGQYVVAAEGDGSPRINAYRVHATKLTQGETPSSVSPCATWSTAAGGVGAIAWNPRTCSFASSGGAGTSMMQMWCLRRS
jgi:WD40 repeat protein